MAQDACFIFEDEAQYLDTSQRQRLGGGRVQVLRS